MAWLGPAGGVFKLHDSDAWCGSFITTADAGEILGVDEKAVAAAVPVKAHAGVANELDLAKAWGRGAIAGAPPAIIGRGTRSLDELILIRLIELTLPGAVIEPQVPFGRKQADLAVSWKGRRVIVEFTGPSHFIRQYDRPLRSPLERKAEIEHAFGDECVIWPYWIQRCARNVRALFDPTVEGLAAVWSTKAMFGDFELPDSGQVVVEITERFHALYPDGIGYMFGNSRTPNKPEHPVVGRWKAGQVDNSLFVPPGDAGDPEFWLPAGD